MSSNDITFVARLRDYLTGPTNNATQALERFEKAAAKAGTAGDKTAKSFEHVRNSAGKIVTGMAEADRALGRHYDSLGRVQEANGQWVKGAQKAAWANDELALAAARADKAADKQRNTMSKLGTIMAKVDAGMSAAAGNGSTRLERALGKVQGGTSRLSRALNNVDPNSAVNRFAWGMSRMSDAAEKASSKITNAMKKAGGAIGLAVGALGTASIIGGGTRLTDIEGADVKLEVMGYDDATKSSIMNTVEQSVIGTPFGLGEAAKVGTQLLGSGVGTDLLADRLQTTVNVASLYGNGDIGDISTVLSQIQAKGRLMGEEALQLNERGMPVYDWIAESKGIEKSEVADLISDGGVTSDDFWAAMAPRVAGGSQLMGETFKGVFANMRTAFSRSGALFLAPLMDPLKDLMRGVTETLNNAKPFFTELGNRVAPGIAAAAEHAPKLAAALEPLGGPLLAAAGSFADLLPEIVQGLTLWFMVLGLILPPLISFASYLADLVGPFLPVLIPLLMGAGAAFTTWRVLKFVSPLLGGVGKGLGFIGRLLMNHPLLRLATLLYAGIKALEWLYENVGWVREAFDWLGDSVRGALGFFDDLAAKISDLIEDKFPRLHAAATTALNFGSGKTEGEGGSSLGDWVMGVGARAGEWAGLPDVGGRRSALLNVPHHALGGFTASGAHMAILGEEGREFVIPHYASEKLAAVPGALGAIHQGKVPAAPVPVPMAAGADFGAAAAPVVFNQNFTLGAGANADTAREFAAQWKREMAMYSRERRLTTNTLTARGAH